jgi:hypothetical protein
MSEWRAGDAVRPPDGRRRRRLTLAPQPWAVERCGGSPAAEGVGVLFADSALVSSVARGAEEGGASEESYNSRSSVGSSSEALPCAAWSGCGSRFWALAGEESSGEEEDESEVSMVSGVLGSSPLVSPPATQGPGVQRSGTPTGPVAGAGGRLCSESRCGVSGRPGQALEPHPKLTRRRRMSGKPWRGPLPPVRSAKLVSLGELRVTDRRGGGRTPVSFLSELEEDLGVPPASGEKAGSDPVDFFESLTCVPVGLCGPDVCRLLRGSQAGLPMRGGLGVLRGQDWEACEGIGPRRLFRCLPALGRLFQGQGILIARRRAPSTAPAVRCLPAGVRVSLTKGGSLLSGILPGYSCKEGRIVEDGLLVEFPCTPTRTRSV